MSRRNFCYSLLGTGHYRHPRVAKSMRFTNATASDSTAASSPQPREREPWKSTLFRLSSSVVVLLVCFEMSCQILLWRINLGWQAIRNEARHYYQVSDNPVLVYELKRNYSYTMETRRLHINQYGIRDDHAEVPTAEKRIALLGDSVTFGIGLSQDETLPAMLQWVMDPSRQEIAVINMGVPGYGLREVFALLKEKNAIYRVTDVVYLMNPNDFSWRDTVYEGADNGNYRLYRRPAIASVFLIRKAIYRWHKSESIPYMKETLVSVSWYRWMFAGNRVRGYDVLSDMKLYAEENQIDLTVMLLPAGCAYQNGTYELTPMYDDVYAFLKKAGIAALDARDLYAPHAKEWIDSTDHLTLEGNRVTAAFLAEQLTTRNRRPAAE
jgi:hypothetical protein